MISFCQFGAGRIGAIHAENITRHPDARLHAIIDVNRAAAERLASRHAATVATQASVLADPAIDAVVIASSTSTHADLVEAAARPSSARNRSTSTGGAPRRVLLSSPNAGCR